MKVALLLPGISRSSKMCFDSLDKFVLSKFENIDIFIHTYLQSNISVDNSQFEYENTIDDLIGLYNPKKIVVEDFLDVKNDLDNKIKTIKNISAVHPQRSLSAFYKIKKCMEMIDDHSKYDLYIKSRMDVLYEYALDISYDILDDTIYIPRHTNKLTKFENGYYTSYSPDYCEDWIMDHVAVGKIGPMTSYCSAYDNIEALCVKNGMSFHPEYITKQNLIYTNTKINRIDFQYGLFRKPVL